MYSLNMFFTIVMLAYCWLNAYNMNMKTNRNTGNTLRKTYELPKEICEKLANSAKENLRSINFELINILQDYFETGAIKWEPWIIKAIERYAQTRGASFSWAVNDLISQKIEDFNMTKDGIRGDIEGEIRDEKSRKTGKAI